MHLPGLFDLCLAFLARKPDPQMQTELAAPMVKAPLRSRQMRAGQKKGPVVADRAMKVLGEDA